ncbi:transposase, partial [Undibacterium sp. FT137W]|nr:transposase [Undibacterium fentianense]
GPPDSVLTDNGPQFASLFFQGVCDLMGIKNLFTTTYHPQTNGQVERFNRTLVDMLRHYVEEHQEDWDELLAVLTLAYNSRVHRTTGVAPLDFVT